MNTTISTTEAEQDGLISMQELELRRQIEDRIDIEDAEKALAETGNNIPAAEVWKELGL